MKEHREVEEQQEQMCHIATGDGETGEGATDNSAHPGTRKNSVCNETTQQNDLSATPLETKLLKRQGIRERAYTNSSLSQIMIEIGQIMRDSQRDQEKEDVVTEEDHKKEETNDVHGVEIVVTGECISQTSEEDNGKQLTDTCSESDVESNIESETCSLFSYECNTDNSDDEESEKTDTQDRIAFMEMSTEVEIQKEAHEDQSKLDKKAKRRRSSSGEESWPEAETSFITACVNKLLMGETLDSDSEKVSELFNYKWGRRCFSRCLNQLRASERIGLTGKSFQELCGLFEVALVAAEQCADYRCAKHLTHMSITFYRTLGRGSSGSDVYEYIQHVLQRSVQISIWKEQVFWEEMYYDSVAEERDKVLRDLIDRPWREHTEEEQQEITVAEKNFIFGQLGSYSCTMLAFGVPLDQTVQFIERHCRINSLTEEQSQMLLASVNSIESSFSQEDEERETKLRKEEWLRKQKEEWKQTRERRLRMKPEQIRPRHSIITHEHRPSSASHTPLPTHSKSPNSSPSSVRASAPSLASSPSRERAIRQIIKDIGKRVAISDTKVQQQSQSVRRKMPLKDIFRPISLRHRNTKNLEKVNRDENAQVNTVNISNSTKSTVEEQNATHLFVPSKAILTSPRKHATIGRSRSSNVNERELRKKIKDNKLSDDVIDTATSGSEGGQSGDAQNTGESGGKMPADEDRNVVVINECSKSYDQIGSNNAVECTYVIVETTKNQENGLAEVKRMAKRYETEHSAKEIARSVYSDLSSVSVSAVPGASKSGHLQLLKECNSREPEKVLYLHKVNPVKFVEVSLSIVNRDREKESLADNTTQVFPFCLEVPATNTATREKKSALVLSTHSEEEQIEWYSCLKKALSSSSKWYHRGIESKSCLADWERGFLVCPKQDLAEAVPAPPPGQ